jgi:hypothetical protein
MEIEEMDLLNAITRFRLQKAVLQKHGSTILQSCAPTATE